MSQSQRSEAAVLDQLKALHLACKEFIQEVGLSPVQEHAQIWKDYVEQLAVALLEASGDLKSDAGRQLRVLYAELY